MWWLTCSRQYVQRKIFIGVLCHTHTHNATHFSSLCLCVWISKHTLCNWFVFYEHDLMWRTSQFVQWLNVYLALVWSPKFQTNYFRRRPISKSIDVLTSLQICIASLLWWCVFLFIFPFVICITRSLLSWSLLWKGNKSIWFVRLHVWNMSI